LVVHTKFRSTSEQNIYTISGLEEWKQTITEHMPHLSAPQATVLALWSFGMVMAQSCGLTSVSSSLALLLGVKENSVRQRIREWSYAKGDKRGAGRSEIDVGNSFVWLLRWVLSWWPVNEKRLALAMDATSLGQTLVVLAVSVDCLAHSSCCPKRLLEKTMVRLVFAFRRRNPRRLDCHCNGRSRVICQLVI
jgi:hypothetical protein